MRERNAWATEDNRKFLFREIGDARRRSRNDDLEKECFKEVDEARGMEEEWRIHRKKENGANYGFGSGRGCCAMPRDLRHESQPFITVSVIQ